MNANIFPRALIAVLKEEIGPQIALFLDNSEPDLEGLTGWLQAADSSAGLTFQSLNFPVMNVTLSDFDKNVNLLVLDHDLHFLAGIPLSIQQNYQPILDQADQVIEAARSGEDDPLKISHLIPNESLTIATPIYSKSQQLLGVLVLRTVYPPRGLMLGVFSYIGGSLIFFTFAAGAVGTIFGFITARGLTRRINKVSKATDQWAEGDFSTFIQENKPDELGQLAQRLNRMAEQLQNLLQSKQELAALEERNRLAQDLHDGVKQQVFASAMQLGTARALMDTDPKAAHKHLDEAEKLAQQSQQELTGIIRELQPASIAQRGFIPALRDLINDWSRINKIPVVNPIGEICTLQNDVEQALFRIVQEGLSNVARHSQASQVKVEFSCTQEEASLIISDDGIGFDQSMVEDQSLGLRNMTKRIEALGGKFLVESSPGQGTQLTALCPLNQGEP
ncbi:MAG: sensor histidine kinase [Anaerolineales bacterium]